MSHGLVVLIIIYIIHSYLDLTDAPIRNQADNVKTLTFSMMF